MSAGRASNRAGRRFVAHGMNVIGGALLAIAALWWICDGRHGGWPYILGTGLFGVLLIVLHRVLPGDD